MATHAHIALTVNGEPAEVAFAPYKTLLEVLREDLALPGTKHGCELGECGACAVLLDGQPVLSCLVVAAACDGRTVATVEGMMGRDGRLHALREPLPVHRVQPDLRSGRRGRGASARAMSEARMPKNTIGKSRRRVDGRA